MQTESTPNRSRPFHGAFLLAFFAGACGSPAPESAAPRAAAASKPASSAEAPSGKIRWKDASDAPLLELNLREGGYTIKDAADIKIGSVSVSPDRVKLKDRDGGELAKVKLKDDGGAELEDAAGNRLLRIKLDEDGSFKVKNVSDETVYKAKLKDDGYEVRDASGATLAKVKRRAGKVNFKTEGGESLGELKGTENARAAMWLALDGIPVEQRAALVIFFLAVYQ